MGGIDKLISIELSSKIKKGLELDILKKIERELFLEHGMSIKLSIEHFQKFVNVLKKNSNINVNKYEKDCINQIIKIKKKDDRYFINMVDSNLISSVLELFGDLQSRKIILVLLENEYTIPQILKESKIIFLDSKSPNNSKTELIKFESTMFIKYLSSFFLILII